MTNKQLKVCKGFGKIPPTKVIWKENLIFMEKAQKLTNSNFAIISPATDENEWIAMITLNEKLWKKYDELIEERNKGYHYDNRNSERNKTK